MVSLIVGYLIGSIPFSYILARGWGHIDLRTSGSQNVGATNVFRTSGPLPGVAALGLDIAKGAAAVLISRRAGGSSALNVAAGLSAIIGHVYPVWLRFHGGKGVATACGMFAVLAPIPTTIAVLVFVVAIWWTRFVSLGSVIASVVLVPVVYVGGAERSVVIGAVLASAIIVVRHKPNLMRIRAGAERRIGPEEA